MTPWAGLLLGLLAAGAAAPLILAAFGLIGIGPGVTWSGVAATLGLLVLRGLRR
jgi:hypothetical protein